MKLNEKNRKYYKQKYRKECYLSKVIGGNMLLNLYRVMGRNQARSTG